MGKQIPWESELIQALNCGGAAMIGIYKITKIENGKSYIGQSNNIERRFKEHQISFRKQYADFAEQEKIDFVCD